MCVSSIPLFYVGYTVAGVESGYACFCVQSIRNTVREPETDCNKTCPGDRTSICGGILRLSVYDTKRLSELQHLALTHCGCVCFV